MKTLYTGIYSLFTAEPANTLHTAVGGRLRPHEAKSNDPFPYVVYSLVSNVPDPHFGGSKDIERYRVQFSIFSEKNSPTEALALFGYLKDLFDGCTLTVTGYTFLKCMREGSNFYRHPETDIWQHNTDYIIEVSV